MTQITDSEVLNDLLRRALKLEDEQEELQKQAKEHEDVIKELRLRVRTLYADAGYIE